MTQDISVTCDGYGKKFSIEHALSCPKGGLVLERHDDAAKEWGALGSRALVPSAITYEPKINSMTYRATRNGAWLSAVLHCLKGTELSSEEFRDNLRLRYGLMP